MTSKLSPWYSVDQGPFSYRWPFSKWRQAAGCGKAGVEHTLQDRLRDVSVSHGSYSAAEFVCGCLLMYSVFYGPRPETLPEWKRQ